MFNNIENIISFESAYALLEYIYGTDEIESGLSADEIDMFKSLNDYEYMRFFLINDNFVIVADGFGNVSGHCLPIYEFKNNTIEYVKGWNVC